MNTKNIISIVFLLLSVCFAQQIQIPIRFEKSSTTIELYNLKGQKVLSKEFLRYNSVPFSISDKLSKQVYIMRIKNASNELTRKFTPGNKIQFTGNFNINGKKNLRGVEEVEDSSSMQELYQTQRALRAAPPLPCGGITADPVTKVAFINGIFNSPRQADANLRKIEYAYSGSLANYPGTYIFELWYNPGGSVGDLFEVVEQLANEVVRTDDATAADLKNKANETFANKERLIIIAHSQGNIYANNLVNSFSEKEKNHTAVLNIAPPTTSPSKGWYFTNNNDAVINLARQLYNSSILPGAENAPTSIGDIPLDGNYHKFWEAYFLPTLLSRMKIDDEFISQCGNLAFWAVENSIEYNIKIYYFTTTLTTTLDVLKNDGSYAFLFTHYGATGRKTYNENIKVSNVALDCDGKAIVRFTNMYGSYYSTYPKMVQGMYDVVNGEKNIYSLILMLNPGITQECILLLNLYDFLFCR